MTIDLAHVMTEAQAPEDLFGDAVLADRDGYFARWREQSAVVHLPANRLWALTRYDVINAALTDPEAFSSAKATFNDLMNSSLRGSALASDPPEHSAHRAVLAKYLSPRVVRAQRAGMDEYAEELLAAAGAAGGFDAARLAQAFHQRIIGQMIGMRREIQARVVPWGDSALNVFGPFNARTGKHFPVAGDLLKWAKALTPDQLTEGSVGRAVFDAADRGEIPHAMCNGLIHQLVAAGIDTAIASLGNVIAHVGDNPEQYALLRENPDLIGAAFTESLRFESPIHAMGRLVTRDVEIEGTLIPAGEQVAILFPAGNRDPRHYVDPDAFRIERNPVDHLSFGHGVHTCAGMTLVRHEAEALLSALLRHVERFEVGERHRKLSNMVSSCDRIPVTITALA